MNITTVDDFTESIPVIDDGDTCGQIEHGATAQALGNRTHNLNRRTIALESVTRAAAEDGSALNPVLLQLANADNTLDALPLPNESQLGAANQIGVMGRRLAAWIRYTHERLLGFRAGTTTIYLPLMPVFHTPPATKWDVTIDGTLGRVLTMIDNDLTPVYLALPLPAIAGVIKEVGVYVIGGAGHAGLPATRPRVRLIRPGNPAGVWADTELAAADDPSASVGAYQGVHTISLTNLNVVVQPSAPSVWTYLHVTGESGANSIDGEFKMKGIYVNVAPN